MSKKTEELNSEIERQTHELERITNEVDNANQKRMELEENNEKLLKKNAEIRYFIKHRDEMKATIHSLAQDLQKIKEGIGSDTKIWDDLKDKIKTLEDYAVEVKQTILTQAEKILKDREGWQAEAATQDKNMFAGNTTLAEIQLEIVKSKKALLILKKQEGEYNKLTELFASLSEDVSSLTKIKTRLAKDVRALEDKRDKQNERAVDLKALAQELADSLTQVHKDTKDFRNKVYFYIRRIVQYYRERGEKAPLVFEEFKPNVPIRADILKRLKLLARSKENV